MSFSVWGASSVPPTAPPRFTVRSRISSKAQFEQMRQEISARASLSSRSKKYIGAPTTLARAHGSRRFRTVVGQTMRQAPGSRTTSLERVLLNQEQHHEREKEQEKEQEKRERDEGVSGANQENELQVVPAEEPNPSSQPEVRRPHTHDPKYGGGRKYRGPVLRRWKVYVPVACLKLLLKGWQVLTPPSRSTTGRKNWKHQKDCKSHRGVAHERRLVRVPYEDRPRAFVLQILVQMVAKSCRAQVRGVVKT